MTYHEQYAIGAALTLAVELPVALLVARRVRLLASDLRLLGTTLLGIALTHPAMWYVPWFFFAPALTPVNYPLYLAVGETATVLVKTLVFWGLLVPHRPWLALALGTLGTAASYGVGLLVWAILAAVAG
ncbi:MAG: hypothetical protein JXB32_02850 [Deltaproteobacteria bacterium]|nr:hypothetical protein [Deltaproteobacteria bacterium]